MYSTGDKIKIMKIVNYNFNSLKERKHKKKNKSNNIKNIYYPIYNKPFYENKNKYCKYLKPTKQGGGIIIQPGGGFKGN